MWCIELSKSGAISMSDGGDEVGLSEVVAVRGSVVDIRFAPGRLPPLLDAVVLQRDRGPPIVAEVQLHLDDVTARAAPQSSAALSEAVIESLVSENAARLTGMESAHHTSRFVTDRGPSRDQRKELNSFVSGS